jgi:hypothetical protein
MGFLFLGPSCWAVFYPGQRQGRNTLGAPGVRYETALHGPAGLRAGSSRQQGSGIRSGDWGLALTAVAWARAGRRIEQSHADVSGPRSLAEETP